MTSTTAIELKRPINRVYIDVYLKRRFPDGTYESSWFDISRYVLSTGLDSISYALDSGDFDVGVFSVSNVKLIFDNRNGRFNDYEDSRSLWGALNTRHLSKIKIVAGYLDTDRQTKIDEMCFEGLIDERSFSVDVKNDTVSCTVLSREYAFQTVNFTGGTVGTGSLASEVLYIILNRPEITSHMTLLETNINPSLDVVIDNPNVWAGSKLNDVLNEIMLITNSILYIDKDGYLIVRDRAHSRRVAFEFFNNSETGNPDNIYSISSFNSGRQRVKNYISWGSGTDAIVSQSEDEHLERYGISKKSVSSDAITNTNTIQTIVNGFLDEWQFPKQELEIETDYLANEIGFFDLVTIDYKPQFTRKTDMPICGIAVCGLDKVTDYSSGFKIDSTKGFKVLSIEHSLSDFKTRLKLREIGNQLNDGTIYMILTKAIDITFTAESTKDINVATYSMNAQRCKVEIVDKGNSYVTEEFRVLRPSSSVIRIVSGVAITGNYRVLCSEVEE